MTNVAVAAQHLIKPHGGTLVDRSGYRPDGVDSLEKVELTSRELSDLDMIACGALSPLEGFMGKRGLRVRGRGHAPRERPAVGAARLPGGGRRAER